VVEQLTILAARLTDRDRRILRLVHQHRCFTTHQLAAIFFDSADRAEHRLRQLTQERALERFRPLLDYGEGSAPFYYVLGPAGAAVLAGEKATDVRHLEPAYRREKVLALAHSEHLAHTVGVNGFFCDLIAFARQHHPTSADNGPPGVLGVLGAALTAWWSEWRCHARWDRLVRPDGYGRWHHDGREIDFFVEYDRGTEPLDRLVAKLSGYERLAIGSQLWTPILFWVLTPGREANLRQALTRDPRWRTAAFVIATACAALGRGPAEAAWLPLGEASPRRRLIDLAPGREPQAHHMGAASRAPASSSA